MAVYSDGNFPEKGMEMFHHEAKKAGLCIAEKLKLPAFPTEDDYRQVVQRLLEIKMARISSEVGVAVIFCVQRDNKGLVRAANTLFREKSERITWVANIAWGNRADVTNGNEFGGEGAITMSFNRGNEEIFKEYFLNSTPWDEVAKRNPWFQEFWQQQMQCRLLNASIARNDTDFKNCDASAHLPKNIEIVPVGIVINAVFALAHALDEMHKHLCPNMTRLCPSMRDMKGSTLLKYLKNVTFYDAHLSEIFRFNKNGEVNGKYGVFNFKKVNGSYRYVRVGSWNGALTKYGSIKGTLDIDETQISWGLNSSKVPVSFCSNPCRFGQVTIRETTNSNCCWFCVTCNSDAIIVNNTCIPCPCGQMPDTNLSQCTQLPVHYPSWGDIPANIITGLVTLGLLGTLTTAVFYILNKEHPVVKAASKELSATIFMGVTLCYIAALLWLLKPSRYTCGARRFIGSISLTTCYAPILLRTTRIYRIFMAAKKTTKRPYFVTPTTQIFAAFCIVGVQVIITGKWSEI